MHDFSSTGAIKHDKVAVSHSSEDDGHHYILLSQIMNELKQAHGSMAPD